MSEYKIGDRVKIIADLQPSAHSTHTQAPDRSEMVGKTFLIKGVTYIQDRTYYIINTRHPWRNWIAEELAPMKPKKETQWEKLPRKCKQCHLKKFLSLVEKK
jgi:hypothetical protein